MKYGNLLVFKDFFWICRLQETSKEVLMVPKAGLEPARISTVDFESTASHKSLIIITNLLRTYGSYRQFRQQIAPAK
ncbi:TPA: hypothetical protein MCA43_000316 [Klebsiella pneumoniae]|nr:hypothetical protein [Klebsiella pneumoniae]